MRIRWRIPAALATGIGLLMGNLACTGPAEEESPADTPSPAPPPTDFLGEVPPGLAPEPLRTLHDSQEDPHEILDDSMGVRVQAVGDAFLISSHSTERHLLQSAADGSPLWEGNDRVERFTVDREGEAAFTVLTEDGPERRVLSHTGEELWRSDDPQEIYLDGWVVHRPEDWSAASPYGEYRVGDTEGEEVWSWEFSEPEEDGEEDGTGEDGEEEEAADPERLGVPVAAARDVLLLTDRSGLLQAHDLADGGEPLWHLSGDQEEIAADEALPRPDPQIVGLYPAPENGEDEEEEEAEPSALLVRWSHPESPSLLSLVDLASGEPYWTLAEPGANPVDTEFPDSPATGTVHNPAARMLLLQQSSGTTPVIAVDLDEGTVAWEFEDDDEVETSISPTFPVGPYVYGDSRGVDGDYTQLVLEARTKDIIAEDLDAYVEAVSDDGHALVVRDRQRYVFPFADEAEDASALRQ